MRLIDADTFKMLHLLYSWIVENEWWAYIELSQKFKKIYRLEEVGKSLKLLLERIQSSK